MIIVANLVFFLAGLFLLYIGGSYLVNHASALAFKLNIAPIIIGLTIVAFGTSAPEFFVTLVSVLGNQSDIGLGNIVGSNIVNIALILGLSSVLLPMTVEKTILRRDIPIMFLSYVLLLLAVLPMFWDSIATIAIVGKGRVLRIEGFVLSLSLFLYLFIVYRSSQKNKEHAQLGFDIDTKVEGNNSKVHQLAEKPIPLLLLLIGLGILALSAGSEFLVRSASWFAVNVFNASERFIGVSIIALGTSLPELVTSILASIRKEVDITVGNIIGSNIFNSLMVLGVSSLIKPLDISADGFLIDIIVMIVISACLYVILLIRKRLGAWTGLAFLLIYAAYFVYLLQTRSLV